MDKSTPRPWAFDGQSVTAEGLRDKILLTGFALVMGRDDQAEANTAVVLRSVNAFDALVEALREVQIRLLADHPGGAVNMESVKRAREIARAALALAKEIP